MAKKNDKKRNNDELIVKIIAAVVATSILLTAVFKLGTVGIILNNILRYVFGELYLLVVVSVIFLCLYHLYLNRKFKLNAKIIVGIVLLNIAVILAFAQFKADRAIGTEVFNDYFATEAMLFSANDLNYGGGLIGVFIYAGISSLFGGVGTLVLIIALLIISAVLIVPLDVYGKFFAKAKTLKSDLDDRIEEKRSLKKDDKEVKDTYLDVIDQDDNHQDSAQETFAESLKSSPKAFIDIDEAKTPKKTTEDTSVTQEPKTIKKNEGYKGYRLPPLNVFDEPSNTKISNINKTSADVKGKKVIEILHNFDIDASLIATHIGPTVTKFEIKPQSGVKVSRIQNIADNLKMELAARDIRIEAPIPGRSAVGIEIPNVEPLPVRMRELIKGANPNDKNAKLLFYLGKDLLGKVVTCQLDKMPHLLIAGATGSGKSVCINAIITSILYRTNPSEVKLVLVDPKKVEFTPYHDVPHLLWPVITDATIASNMLKKIVVMMEERFDVFAEVGARNIETYNNMVDDFNAKNDDPEKKMNRLPFIVIIIDELADLMMVQGKEVEGSIQRITQLARASGIHLIVATQRPSTDVITGIIKSNIPSRISFSVASSIDSRTILDQTGAERLLGNGDMLYFPQGEPSPIRLQGVYVTDKEVRTITDYVKSQAKPDYDDSYFEFLNLSKEGGQLGATKGESDSLYEEVRDYVIDVQKASTSLLQRKFGIGYNRAAGLIESLEENGIIGPANGSKPREVYIKKEDVNDSE